MEKKDLLGVRKKLPAAASAAKRRRKVVTPPAKAARAGGRLAKAIAEYLASDSYMYAPLVSAPPAPAPPPSPPPAEAAVAPSAARPVATPEKEVHWCKNTEDLCKQHSLPTRSICGHVLGAVCF